MPPARGALGTAAGAAAGDALPAVGARRARGAVSRRAARAARARRRGASRHHRDLDRAAPRRSRRRAPSQVPPVDAPNVAGARLLGLTEPAPGAPPTSARRCARTSRAAGSRRSTCSTPVRRARSATPRGSSRRARAGKLATLVVQGVLATPLAQAADIVLAGRLLGREGCLLHQRPRPAAGGLARHPAAREGARGRRHPAASGAGLRAPASVCDRRPTSAPTSPRRSAPSRASPGSTPIAFARPSTARHWLQASNPMERQKWDHMFNDLPPVKFADTIERRPVGKVIPVVGGSSRRVRLEPAEPEPSRCLTTSRSSPRSWPGSCRSSRPACCRSCRAISRSSRASRSTS